MSKKIVSHDELIVYRKAFDAAMQIFERSKTFPKEETYSLTDQVRRSSRSVCANVAEAWRKRRYEKAFVSKLSDAESEAAETQVWLKFAVACGYMPPEAAHDLYTILDTGENPIMMSVRHDASVLFMGNSKLQVRIERGRTWQDDIWSHGVGRLHRLGQKPLEDWLDRTNVEHHLQCALQPVAGMLFAMSSDDVGRALHLGRPFLGEAPLDISPG